jgi:hypothetical protein
MTIKGILWHSTGVSNSNLKRYIQPSDEKPAADTYAKEKWLEVLGKNKYNNDWNHIEKQAGLNAWIGKLATGEVAAVQTMPWDLRPWGCGTGKNGSCNDGFIQFEICEATLDDKEYFNKVYKEACELTAYLCKIHNIDPEGTTTINGVKIPTITCHNDAYKLGLASNHSDVNHWFKKHGKSMKTARADVVKLIKEPEVKKLYRVRKSKTNAKSQVGAFSSLDNAIAVCKKAGAGYHVFDWEWSIVYSCYK